MLRKPYLIIFWFFPILIAISTGRFSEIGVDVYVRYIQLSLVVLGLLYIVMQSATIRLSITIMFVLFLLAFNMLYADIREYQLVIFLISYAFMVHLITKSNPHEIWSQYYFICLVIAGLTIIDFIAFFVLGEFIISFRTPEVIGIGLPRINTVFDEMSHQAFFMMPAAIYSVVYKDKWRVFLVVTLLLTMSVSALILFAVTLLIYLRKKLLHNIISYLPFIILITLALFFASDFIISKLTGIFEYDKLISGEQKKPISAGNILLGIEVLKNIPVSELLVGYGYFGYETEVSKLLGDSSLFNYFELTGSLKIPKSIGILNMVLYFGLMQFLIVIFILVKLKRQSNDMWLYQLALFIVLLSMLKNSHTIDYLVHLFFVFGLSWASTYHHRNTISNCYIQNINKDKSLKL